MNQLYWKEWREQRQFALAMPLIYLALLVTYSVLKGYRLLDDSQVAAPWTLDTGAAVECLGFIWVMSAALCGALVMAPEVSSGTLRFLSTLPVTRGRLWTGKVLAASAAAVACTVGSTLVFFAVCMVARISNRLDGPLEQNLNGAEPAIILAVCVCAVVFAVGSYVSMLLERTINAVLATIVVSFAVGGLIAWVVNSETSGNLPLGILDACYLLAAALFLWMSRRTFQLGETLQTSRRFSVLRWPRWIGDFLLVGVALAVAYLWIMR